MKLLDKKEINKKRSRYINPVFRFKNSTVGLFCAGMDSIHISNEGTDMDASLGLSFSQMRHNKIMARKKVPRKSYEREFQKFSSVRPFYVLYILLCRVCVIIYVTFSSDRSRGAAVRF